MYQPTSGRVLNTVAKDWIGIFSFTLPANVWSDHDDLNSSKPMTRMYIPFLFIKTDADPWSMTWENESDQGNTFIETISKCTHIVVLALLSKSVI